MLTRLSALAVVGCDGSDPVAIDGELPGEDALLEVLPFLDEGDAAVGVREGAGLEGRLAYDLRERAVQDGPVPTDAFFLRTFEPVGLVREGWQVELPDGPVPAEDLAALASDRGEVLLECSGNSRNRAFGLIGAARWAGVPLDDLLAPGGDPLIEITGFDAHEPPFGSSTPGASWIFRRSALSEGFLATGMNGAPLTPDHGAPVRLIVPGWYGCANLKWVTSVRVVDEDVPPSSQMIEFAQRTHQPAVFDRARDFLPATAQCSALAVRVGRYTEGRVVVHGIAWGERSGRLTLRVGGRTISDSLVLVGPQRSWEPWAVVVDEGSLPRGEQTLSLAAEPHVPQLRLDAGTYTRTVRL